MKKEIRNDEEEIRRMWSLALDEETERRYYITHHHPPEDCPLWFINQFKEYTEEALQQERERIIEEYKDALIWCSGSQDFQLEGKAREGWEKICLPLLSKK